ncbi:MAG: lactate utilization protein [Thaumarchaeota archaeon]|nr:lactate utilization protein [Nitrososphaerota archaeon]
MSVNIQKTNENEKEKTEFGIPIDYSFSKPATEEQIQRAAAALKARKFNVEVVDTPAAARTYVNSILPKGKNVLTPSSETVRLSGLDEDINTSGQYKSVRNEIMKLDRSTQMHEMRKLGATPDAIVGSAAAVTEDGRILVGSASGSQIGPYSAGATMVVLVVGSQKIVPDLATGLRRLEDYSYPKEDIRARAKYGMGSFLAKTLIISGDYPPGRTTVVLIREPIGY